MLDNLSIALQMTALGMGLVFGAILLLWAVMVLLVRLTPEREEAPIEEPAEVAVEPEPETEAAPGHKKRAAVAAVALAVAISQEAAARPKPVLTFVPPPAHVTPWQAVMRGNQLNKTKRPAR